jgi:hypothetical protein
MTITKEDARRQEIEDVVHEIPRQPAIKSRHRDDSAAHKRGAIDYSSKDLTEAERHEEARQLSDALGSKGIGHTVVVEEVHVREPGTEGPSGQVNTAYRDGVQGNVRVGEAKATATHTHVQPEERRTPVIRDPDQE